MQVINATQARDLFPKVIGDIRSATLASGYAVLDMGPSAYGVMVAGRMVACCPTRDAAHEAGRDAPKPWDSKRTLQRKAKRATAVRS